MNKKVLTLCAGFLLAGGMLTSASASIQEMVEGVYYKMAIAEANQEAEKYFLDSEGNKGQWWIEGDVVADFDGSAWWTVEKVKDPVNGNVIAYRLKNKEGVYYTVKSSDGKKSYNTFEAQTSTVSVNVSNGNLSSYWGLKVYGEDLYAHRGSAVASTATLWGFDDVELVPASYTAKALNHILGGSFAIQICKQVIKSNGDIDTDKAPVEYTNLKGNVFTTDLVAVQKNGGVELYQGNAKTGKQIVLTSETWGNLGGGNTQEGYKFAAVTQAEKKALDNKVIATVFNITRPATVSNAPLEVSVMVGETKYELIATEALKGEFCLTVAKSGDNSTADYTYDKETRKNQNTYVIFGQSNGVDYSDFYGKLWNITKDGDVASPSCSGDDYVPAAQVALNFPEGQWLYNGETGNFVNRESGKKLTIQGLRYVEGKEHTYVAGESTYTITPAGDPSDKATIGYLNGFTEDQLKQKAFFIGTPLVATGDTVYLTKAANGALQFSKDKTEAVEFRLTMADFDNEADKSFKTAQTITEYTVWKNKAAGTTDQKHDVLNFHQYAITEAVTGDVLYYNSKEQRFDLADEKNGFNPIVIKNKAADAYNLLYNVSTTGVDYNDDKVNDAYLTNQDDAKSFCNAQKLYGAHNANELVKSQGAYKFVQNDIFVVVDADAQQYRGDFSDTGVLDTIKVFRNDDPSYVLYEKGTLLAGPKGEAVEGFLGMENINDPQYKDMHAAMLADTAFHANTYRPQYMLAVDVDIVADGWTCPLNPEHNTAEWREEHGGHCADAVKDRPYIQGRYLVNLVDSAKAFEGKKNPFIYQNDNASTEYYRLGFVQAKHIGDSLIIASTNDTIDLANNPEDKVCTFAFKYVDANRDAFTIETLYDYTVAADDNKEILNRTRGYIKYHNGTPVVTSNPKEAWVFDLEELTGEENAPTANEEINAEGNVVVAGVNGAVVVKGAEGKNVIVSTILGKVVANEVVSSDNATIAAPAGVVVVSVDGESFKVVVK